ncbi:cytidylyltransferase domain-containing protein [Pseudoalteromonas denitrificans]|uniref:Spore coat polysaccharide biosynthesis protein SpsF n=1 Tax=Pseudoalteromonas denitrificans DSM 6059 TaxID=1123010 RepID=A0A1I1HRI7_9GAMM|nr:glycosyltransferase family protein [Pseudoalteromonas denitrificans]SFC24053.1 spore coat polysaccharide biosynthesis protein SpsF [Pseudoalteromonas denitrificans DSM 6059]
MILAIIQARMSSSRLPGKVLKPILGKPVLALQIERTLRSKKIDKLIIATSQEHSDTPIEVLCHKIGIECYRGDLNDVLKRFNDAAEHYKATHIVRLTGDCPLVDPELIDQVITHHINGNYEYTSNIYPRSFPDGLDIEVLSKETLTRINQTATSDEDREHVTYFIDKNTTQFFMGNIAQQDDHSLMRWTLDTQDDFDFISQVYAALYHKKPNFTTLNILDYLEL